jgi:plasmid stability protein
MAGKTRIHIDDSLAERLRIRGAQNGRSPQDEASALLRDALGCHNQGETPHLVEVAKRLFGKRHGVELSLPPRHRTRVVRGNNER